MCGIVGYIGSKPVLPILLDGLKKLEYRGYDSAGVSCVSDGTLRTVKAAGKIVALENKLKTFAGNSSSLGIGHTRWATPPSSGQNVRFHLLNPGRKGDFYVQKNYRYNTQGFIS